MGRVMLRQMKSTGTKDSSSQGLLIPGSFLDSVRL